MKKNVPIIVAVVLAGLVIVWALTNKNTGTSENIASSGNTVVAYEEISLGHDGRNIIPIDTTLAAGKSYKISITPEQNGQGCMNMMKLPGIDDQPKPIVQGKTLVYTLDNPKPGTYTFVCNAMGMKQGSITIQ